MFIIYAIIRFFVQALALKLAVNTMREPGTPNLYGTALTVSAGLGIASYILGFIPFVGWLVYIALWCGVMMSTYRLSFLRSLGVAFLQFLISIALLWALKLIGFDLNAAQCMMS